MKAKVLVVGSSNTDMILQLPTIPRPGETLLGGDFSVAAGGKGANQAVAAARTGGRVTFIASIGADTFGDQALAGFEKEGIDVRWIRRDAEHPSGVALIFVSERGENSIGVASGANATLTPKRVRAAEDVFASSAVVLLQLETPLDAANEAIDIANEHGVPVILNPAPAMHLPDSLIAKLDFLTPNESELETLTGIPVADRASAEQAARVLLNKGAGHVLVTLGADGVLHCTGASRRHYSAFPVDPVDTTGAGDVFNGALATALAEKKPVHEAILFAVAAASISVGRLGAQPGIPRRDEVNALLANQSA